MVYTPPAHLHSYQYGNTCIRYTIVRSERKHLRISVHPDRSIEVRCPEGISDEEVAESVKRRAAWIIDQLDFFLSFEPRYTLKQYVPGESHRYLGRQYRLRWIPLEDNTQPSCALRGAFFEITCATRAELRPLLKAWFKEKAELRLLAPLCEDPRAPRGTFVKDWIAYFKEVHGVAPKSISVRPLKNRWGTCTPSGKVVLNPRLIHHRRAEIEYVIVHELCHLLVPNHGRKFVDLLRRTLPDFEERKGRLEYGV